MSTWPAPPDALSQGRAFLGTPRERWMLAPDGDVDGLTAGALAQRTLERLGAPAVFAELARKGERLASETFLERMAQPSPEALVVLDQGSQPCTLLRGVPTLVIDHHVPRGFPEGAVAVSAAGHEPVASSSLLAFEVCRAVADIEDLKWLAVLGTAADLSLDAPFPELFALVDTLGRKNVTEAIALLNAPRRSSLCDASSAWNVLLRARAPIDIAKGRVDGVERLRDARAEVNAEVSRWGKAAPRFSGQVALIRIHSPAKIHALMAARWANRLPKYAVLAANTGYLPERVNFSMRTRSGVDLMQLLRAPGLDLGTEFANGHPQATGGNVTPDDFERLLSALGFDASVRSHAAP